MPLNSSYAAEDVVDGYVVGGAPEDGGVIDVGVVPLVVEEAVTVANTSDLYDDFNTTPTICYNDYCVSDEAYVDMMTNYIYPQSEEWVIIVLYAVVFIVGLAGNFLVCFAVLRNQHMRTVTNYFIVNLSVADFMVILICLPPSMLEDITETWYMGRAMCKAIKYIQAVSVAVSVFTLTVISIERWYAICRPLSFKSTTSRARLMIFLIWMVSLAIVTPELFAMEVYTHSHLTVLLTACRSMWTTPVQTAYQMFLTVAIFFLPFTFMAVCYQHIARNLWSNQIPTECGNTPLNASNRNSSAMRQLQARRNVAKMLIAVVVMFGISYLPVHLLNIIRYLNLLPKNSRVGPYLALVAHWLCYFNSAVNPLIYNFMSAKFRKEFRSACACCTCVCRRDERRRRHDTYGDSMYGYKYSNSLAQTEQMSLSTMHPKVHIECDTSYSPQRDRVVELKFTDTQNQ